MINRDYILRLAEQIGRELSIVLRLRKRDQYEQALIAIDDLLLHKVGLTSSFISSLTEEVLVRALSPLGKLNVEACLWIAALLHAEGEIYEAKADDTASYYRYLKALYLFIEALLQERFPDDSNFYLSIKELISKLAAYELPGTIQLQLIRYYEYIGMYAQAENILFQQLEAEPTHMLIEQGHAFYARLLEKDDFDLQAGNFSREEVYEGITQLQNV
ncbi:MAG: hypothetical protein NVS2B12_00570 [Ktedonobacteraceae bacterium]